MISAAFLQLYGSSSSLTVARERSSFWKQKKTVCWKKFFDRLQVLLDLLICEYEKSYYKMRKILATIILANVVMLCMSASILGMFCIANFCEFDIDKILMPSMYLTELKFEIKPHNIRKMW